MNDANLDRYRPALEQWAIAQLPGWMRGKFDPADLVQQCLLEALKSRDRLAGLPDHEALAFLRRILTNNLIDAARKFTPARQEVSPALLAESSCRLADWLVAQDTSPSERAGRNERFERLATRLAQLPDAQRIAVEMRYLQGKRVTEIATFLGRSQGAVAQLLHRAILQLQEQLSE